MSTPSLAAATDALREEEADAVVFDRPILQYELHRNPAPNLTLTPLE